MAENRIGRAIFKLSGEMFGNEKDHISFDQYSEVSLQILKLSEDTGVQIGIVLGGGNILRGRQANPEVDDTDADSMGMLATVINGIGLREALIRNGATDTRLMVPFDVHKFAEPYIRRKAIHHLENGRLVIIAGGMGVSGHSTDSAVAHYAKELNCDIIFKLSNVDGVYDSDPNKNPEAKKYDQITYREALVQDLRIMDQTAFTMCMESKIPIFVFNANDFNRIPDAINGDFSFGTLIHK
ncbi:MAG: uridine monophosphate kinase [Microgenomates group bacterium]